ncbi:hypothetical protein [Kitasatospora brasiliensis]|uniref:hypothetical protein n=1 Tax=Kitasatospora brasiliensis TaxID=3058040 RepID=UPI00292EEE30|nr:hypothetical protein [Kitasatospora sp. K002]
MVDIGPPTDGPFGDDADALDLCDHCGRAVAGADLIGALVPDSSALHPTDPGLDGKRAVLACSAEHLSALVEGYHRRPFVPEEQWAGKVCRALADYDEPMPLSLVAQLSGLSEGQAVEGVEWHNARAREWRQRYGHRED